eukprot:COSAG05_NODE_2293_length_3266_cov_456.310073_3_plen_109_part_00
MGACGGGVRADAGAVGAGLGLLAVRAGAAGAAQPAQGRNRGRATRAAGGGARCALPLREGAFMFTGEARLLCTRTRTCTRQYVSRAGFKRRLMRAMCKKERERECERI